MEGGAEGKRDCSGVVRDGRSGRLLQFRREEGLVAGPGAGDGRRQSVDTVCRFSESGSRVHMYDTLRAFTTYWYWRKEKQDGKLPEAVVVTCYG